MREERKHCDNWSGQFYPDEEIDYTQCLTSKDEATDGERREEEESNSSSLTSEDVETIYRYPSRNPLSVFDKFGCYFRLKFDSVKGGRCHGCRYCYRQQFTPRERLEHTTYYADPNVLLDTLHAVYQGGADQPQIEHLISQGMPRLGSMCDPFAPDRLVRKISLVTLEALVKYQHPFMLFTKNTFVATDPVIKLLAQAKDYAAVHITLSNTDREIEKRMEPYAPTCMQRLKTMKELLAHDIPVVLRIAPITLGVNETSVIRLMQAFKRIGGKKVIIEEVRIGDRFDAYYREHFPEAFQHLSRDFRWHYLRYPEQVIEPLFARYVEYAHRQGLEIGICGNQDLERKLCDNDNCCLFDNAPCKFPVEKRTFNQRRLYPERRFDSVQRSEPARRFVRERRFIPERRRAA